jgi:uncharacterized membrane protein YhfC
MVYVLLILNSLLMLVMPVLLGIWLWRRYKVGWAFFLFGAIGLVASQIVNIPFNQIVLGPFVERVTAGGDGFGRILFVAVLFGLSAGVFEEVTRFILYRFMKNGRDWEEGLMFGTGWGGVESIVLGLWAIQTIVSVYIYQSGLIESLIPADQAAANADLLADTTRQIQTFVDSPPWIFVLGAVESAFSLVIQISLTILVLQVFVRNNIIWLLIAIGWHTLIDAAAYIGVSQQWDPLLLVATSGLFAAASFIIIRYFKPPDDLVKIEQKTVTSSDEL